MSCRRLRTRPRWTVNALWKAGERIWVRILRSRRGIEPLGIYDISGVSRNVEIRHGRIGVSMEGGAGFRISCFS
ncbi:MAG: hypothetical protein MI923_24195 [Phycisphaerales bacterium]|nr:hypothetical protein [Phycisphaerales bacterium]